MPKRECYKYIAYLPYLNGWRGYHNDTEMFQAFIEEDVDLKQVTVFRATAHGSVEANRVIPYYSLSPIETKV